MKALFLAAALLPGGCAATAAETRPVTPGLLVEKIVCADSADHSYALYTPSRYDAATRWPILYVLDPRGRGQLAAGIFQKAAERYGYLVASSYETASDTAGDPNLPAMQAMWRDTHAFLNIDDRRVYAAGFSGTARAAFHMGMTAPGAFAGIIAAAGGFPVHEPPTRSIAFAVFGTTGVFDFNYDEMHDLEAQLTALAIPNRLEVFDGTHQWPGEELAGLALAWMELQAMRAGIRDKDAELIDELWSRDLERARNLATLGQLVDSRKLYVSLVSDFHELRDVTGAERELAELAQDRRLKKEEARLRARRERDQRYLASAGATFERLKSESPVPWAQELISDLEIRSLTRIAKSASDAEEARSARRKLNNDLVFVSFYLPRGFMTLKQYDRAMVSLRIAMEIDPEDPELEFQLARCYAGIHDNKRALSHLRSAIARGVDVKGRLTGDEWGQVPVPVPVLP